MSEPALKCENNECYFQAKLYNSSLFVAFKMAYSCSFGLRGDLDFRDFLQKKFYNINYWSTLYPCRRTSLKMYFGEMSRQRTHPRKHLHFRSINLSLIPAYANYLAENNLKGIFGN